MAAFRKISIVRYNLLGAQDENNEGVVINEVIYDEQGHETEHFNYNSDGELEEHIKVELVNGLPVDERLEFNDELTEHATRTFDEEGRLLTETRQYLEGGTDTTYFEYTGDKMVSRLVVDSDGEEGEKQMWEYKDGRLVREVQYNMFGNIELERVPEYDENGLLTDITETSYREDQPEKTITFFDEQGRMTTEKHYDSKERLVARTTVEYHENGKPIKFEEENVRGKKVTSLGYDDSGNNIMQEEMDQNGQRISLVERTFNETGNVLTVEVIMEPSLYNAGNHYRLEYKYE